MVQKSVVVGSLLLAAVQAQCPGGDYASAASSLCTLDAVSSFCSSNYPASDITTTVTAAASNVTVTAGTATLTTTIATTTVSVTAPATTSTETDTVTTGTVTTITTTTTSTETDTETDTVTSTEAGNPPAKRSEATDTPEYSAWADAQSPDETVRVTVTNTKTFCPSCYATTASPAATWGTWDNVDDSTTTTASSAIGHYYGNATTSTTASYTGPSDVYSSFVSKNSSYISTICACIVTPTTITVTSTPINYANATLTLTSSVTETDTETTTPTITTTETDTATTTNTVTETDTATLTTTTTVTVTTVKPCTTNVLTDKNNCGACGNKCATGLGCFNGQCAQPDACDFTGSIAYCYSAQTCICYQTTEGRGFCANAQGACGATCSTSDDCPGNNVCLTADSVGCTSVNTCSTNDDLSTCPNPTYGYRLFAIRDVVKDVGNVFGSGAHGRKIPGIDA